MEFVSDLGQLFLPCQTQSLWIILLLRTLPFELDFGWLCDCAPLIFRWSQFLEAILMAQGKISWCDYYQPVLKKLLGCFQQFYSTNFIMLPYSAVGWLAKMALNRNISFVQDLNFLALLVFFIYKNMQSYYFVIVLAYGLRTETEMPLTCLVLVTDLYVKMSHGKLMLKA